MKRCVVLSREAAILLHEDQAEIRLPVTWTSEQVDAFREWVTYLWHRFKR
jgi:hypothetical protein